MKESREFAAIAIATALWATAATMMLFGTADSVREHHNSPWLAWGIFLALVAGVPTAWAIVQRLRSACPNYNDVTIGDIAEVMDALHEERVRLTPVR